MRLKILKIALTIALSGCAGNPPKQERPVKFYGGVPEKSSMCRVVKRDLVAFAQKIARHQRTKNFAPQIINASVARDALECIKADEQAFSSMVGIPADDLRVLLQYQESLLYRCEKWRN